MKRKIEYQDQLYQMKREIIGDIIDVVEKVGCHTFKKKMFIHYIEKELATTEQVKDIVYVEEELGIQLNTIISGTTESDVMNDTELVNCDVESLLALRKLLIDEVRQELNDKILDIVKKNGNSVKFERGKEVFMIDPATDEMLKCILREVFVNEYGFTKFKNTYRGDEFDDDSDVMDIDELLKVIDYLKKETEQKEFRVTASNVLSRTFEVKADNWEDAVEKVRQMLKEEPLGEPDGLGLEFM